ncbi:MAG: VWA domain-containing protein [Pyrinomonadaceae bacterium]
MILCFIVSLLVLTATPRAYAQDAAIPGSNPAPSPTPAAREGQDSLTVFTEEVRLPILVTDDEGRFDPTLEAGDILVLEDDVPQEVRSVRHMPANVLLLLDTSGGINPAMKTNTTRAIALAVVSKLKPGDRVSVLQAGDRVELLQPWTTDAEAITRALRTKLSSGKRKHLSEALFQAAAQLKEAPYGNRHLVLVTDGVESTQSSATQAAEAIRQLSGAQAAVHVISYTTIGREAMERSGPLVKFGNTRARTAGDVAREADPTMPTASRGPVNVTIDTDRAMRRQREDFIEALKRSEQRLTLLAAETGGRITSPESTEEMVRQGAEVAREIGAQYVVTYSPRRPLAEARAGEYRRVRVVLRRPGLSVRSRSGYITTGAQ